MTDKKILEEVYRKLETAVGGDAVAIRRFIEQEWQRADEEQQDHGLEGSSYDIRVN